MVTDDSMPLTTDEQLGSPGWTFEKSWLAGLVIGFAILCLTGRRARKRRDQRGSG